MEHVEMKHTGIKPKKPSMKRVHSLSEEVFTKWVFPAVVSSLMETPLFNKELHFTTDEVELCQDESDLWLRLKKASLKSGRLKRIVRHGVPALARKRLWQEVSGGCAFMSRTPDLYHEMCETLFGKGNDLPTNVPQCPLIEDSHFMSYYLNAEGVMILRKILYVLSYVHPDVTYSPTLQAVAAVSLHFMEEVWCFACLSSMLTSKVHYFDQTHSEAAVSAAGFQHCVSTNMKHVLKRLNSFVIDKGNKGENPVIFPFWQRMIFEHLEFTLLVRIIDCFIVEGQKILYRSGMMLLQIFYDYSLAYEKIGCPTAHDLCLAIGQHAEMIAVHPNDFIKACLKIKLKRKKIDKALEVNAALISAADIASDRERTGSMVFGTDVRDLSDIITVQEWQKLISWLPVRIQLLQPWLIFSTDVDGYNLRTLYSKVEFEEQIVLIIQTDTKEVFGAFLSSALSCRNEGRKNLTFFGTGETFLFTIKPNTLPFKWVGIGSTVDAPGDSSLKRQLSFVLVEHKPRENVKKKTTLKRAVHRFSRSTVKLPRSLSSKDFNDAGQSYGGIPKNKSVICLRDLSHGYLEGHLSDSPFVERAPPHKTGGKGEKKIDMFTCGRDSPERCSFTMEEKCISVDEADNSQPNDVFIAGDGHCLIIGGGGGYGLWLDQNLDHGRSETCNTFKNHPLSASRTGDFRCTRVEVFGFK